MAALRRATTLLHTQSGFIYSMHQHMDLCISKSTCVSFHRHVRLCICAATCASVYQDVHQHVHIRINTPMQLMQVCIQCINKSVCVLVQNMSICESVQQHVHLCIKTCICTTVHQHLHQHLHLCIHATACAQPVLHNAVKLWQNQTLTCMQTALSKTDSSTSDPLRCFPSILHQTLTLMLRVIRRPNSSNLTHIYLTLSANAKMPHLVCLLCLNCHWLCL